MTISSRLSVTYRRWVTSSWRRRLGTGPSGKRTQRSYASLVADDAERYFWQGRWGGAQPGEHCFAPKQEWPLWRRRRCCTVSPLERLSFSGFREGSLYLAAPAESGNPQRLRILADHKTGAEGENDNGVDHKVPL